MPAWAQLAERIGAREFGSAAGRDLVPARALGNGVTALVDMDTVFMFVPAVASLLSFIGFCVLLISRSNPAHCPGCIHVLPDVQSAALAQPCCAAPAVLSTEIIQWGIFP